MRFFWCYFKRTLLIPNWGEPTNTLQCWTATQRDLDRLEEGSSRNLTKLQKDKCKVSQLGKVKALPTA